jgi:hypothetical protein
MLATVTAMVAFVMEYKDVYMPFRVVSFVLRASLVAHTRLLSPSLI